MLFPLSSEGTMRKGMWPTGNYTHTSVVPTALERTLKAPKISSVPANKGNLFQILLLQKWRKIIEKKKRFKSLVKVKVSTNIPNK